VRLDKRPGGETTGALALAVLRGNMQGALSHADLLQRTTLVVFHLAAGAAVRFRPVRVTHQGMTLRCTFFFFQTLTVTESVPMQASHVPA
jgi:hypothetical protein